jgi:hypothetical protein
MHDRFLISVDEENADEKLGYSAHGKAGKGSEYWKSASKFAAGGTSNSSGWFIDAVEGFIPGPWTKTVFGSGTADRYDVHANYANSYTYCTGYTSFGVGRIYTRDNPTKRLQKAIGLNTYGDAWSSINYLGLNDVRPPVKRSGDNIVESTLIGPASLTKNPHGAKTPNRGISGNLIYLSFSGLNKDDDSTVNKDSTNKPLADIQFYFDDAVKHASDILFATKLMTTGTMFRWTEDPGQVTYITKFINPGEIGDGDNKSWDSSQGTAMYNFVGFADYFFDKHFYIHRLSTSFLCSGWTPNSCDSWKDTLISRSHDNSDNYVVSGQGGPNGLEWGYLGNNESCCWNGAALGLLGCCWGAANWWCPEKMNSLDHIGASRHLDSVFHDYDEHQVWPSGAYRWDSSYNKRRRFIIKAVPIIDGIEQLDNNGLPIPIGGIGPHFYSPTNDPNLDAHFDQDLNVLTSHPVTNNVFDENSPAPGIRPDGMHTGHADPGGDYNWNNGVSGDSPWLVSSTGSNLLSKEIHQHKRWSAPDATTGVRTQMRPPGSVTWNIIELFVQDKEDNSFTSTNPAIWETEPKEDVGLDIYYEVGQIYPLQLNIDTMEQWVGAIQSDISKNSYVTARSFLGGNVPLSANGQSDIRVVATNGTWVSLGNTNGDLLGATVGDSVPGNNNILIFHRADGSNTSAIVTSPATAAYVNPLPPFNIIPGNPMNVLHTNIGPWLGVTLPWFNCYSFGNGVESDRIRDDYNQVTIDNGPKASTTLEETYLEERRCNGFIWSGIYNSNSGVNDLNQFIQAETITKDVNPGYGCIQKLHARDGDLVAFCEDRVLKVYANKDALYNADGNTNLVATNRVLGDVRPFSGEYGISKNPESFASDSYRSYFSDASRGAILRLSQDGLTPISDAGMRDWFADVLPQYAKLNTGKIIGSFDDKKQEYNITLEKSKVATSGSTDSGGNTYSCSGNVGEQVDFTVTYSESSKGWVSFRSYIQESGVSLNNEYYTFKHGNLYLHNVNTTRNNYYGVQYDSYVNVLLNQAPNTVKSFKTINYDGSVARITQDLNSPDYYENYNRDGWYVRGMTTNLQEVGNIEFIEKEEKYFAQIKGVKTLWLSDGTAGNIDPREFSFQGIGDAQSVDCPTCGQATTWNCSGEPCECVAVYGTSGTYPTKQACENDTKSCCGRPDPSWCCTNGHCVELSDGTGDYATKCDCVNQAKCCDEGLYYLYTCQGLPSPSTLTTGCMDSGTTTNSFITQNRPTGWVGPATNYDSLATIPDCSCMYLALPTYDCINGNCPQNATGNGYYTGPTALADCVLDCAPLDLGWNCLPGVNSCENAGLTLLPVDGHAAAWDYLAANGLYNSPLNSYYFPCSSCPPSSSGLNCLVTGGGTLHNFSTANLVFTNASNSQVYYSSGFNTINSVIAYMQSHGAPSASNTSTYFSLVALAQSEAVLDGENRSNDLRLNSQPCQCSPHTCIEVLGGQYTNENDCLTTTDINCNPINPTGTTWNFIPGTGVLTGGNVYTNPIDGSISTCNCVPVAGTSGQFVNSIDCWTAAAANPLCDPGTTITTWILTGGETTGENPINLPCLCEEIAGTSGQYTNEIDCLEALALDPDCCVNICSQLPAIPGPSNEKGYCQKYRQYIQGGSPNPAAEVASILNITTAEAEYLLATCCDCNPSEEDTVSYGCTDPLAINYDPLAVGDDGSCLYGLGNLPMGEHNMGVMTPNKLPPHGHYWNGSVDAAICVYPPSPGSIVYGSHITKNYNPNASLFQHQGGLVYTESHYWNLGGLTPGNTYTLKWKEIVLALRTVTQCSDCLMGGWAVRISAYNPVNSYTPSYNDLNLATPIYDPITNGTLSYASSLYHDSNCNQNTSQTTTNTAGAPNGSESEWNDRSTTFTTYAPNLRIHFIAYTDFNLCTICHHDTIAQGQYAISTHGSYVGLSELELI